MRKKPTEADAMFPSVSLPQGSKPEQTHQKVMLERRRSLLADPPNRAFCDHQSLRVGRGPMTTKTCSDWLTD